MTRICKGYPCILQYKMKRGSPVRQPTIACCLFSVSSCLRHRDIHIEECEDNPLHRSPLTLLTWPRRRSACGLFLAMFPSLRISSKKRPRASAACIRNSLEEAPSFYPQAAQACLGVKVRTRALVTRPEDARSTKCAQDDCVFQTVKNKGN